LTYRKICNQINAAHASGDMEALFTAVRDLALKLIGDEDAAQDAVLRIWERKDKYSPIGSTFSAWANSIITGVKADYWRIRMAEQLVQHIPLIDIAYGGDLEPVQRFSMTYPNETAKRVFRLRRQGYDLHEIAALIGMTYGALRVQMTRWRKQIFLKYANESPEKTGYRYRGEERDPQKPKKLTQAA
jgi:DNA-directed RNA polymerase specialized sigma24 family protein